MILLGHLKVHMDFHQPHVQGINIKDQKRKQKVYWGLNFEEILYGLEPKVVNFVGL